MDSRSEQSWPAYLRARRVTLRARGHHIAVAADGADALDTAVEQRPDLYVIDPGIPHLGGVEAVEGLRGRTSAPILVVSGRTGSVDEVQTLDAGADDYVTDTGYLRLCVFQLRKKLDPDSKASRFLISEPGMGYRFQPPG
ncbi:DNA-binding response regulator [Nocardiopsis akebiae]|uniref:DNA-binding response regulator n=1 Tax=Nocardiopsis akebiae TaxID=2831968 RepID=A0ABX8C2C7_9ACTN|nr:DNA-binding response regulator [Nocardiopsis akebiae]QUX27261.1 DNA-binding response regulator [Nocardiopsis akebiae]